jgi:hypothetical protein
MIMKKKESRKYFQKAVINLLTKYNVRKISLVPVPQKVSGQNLFHNGFLHSLALSSVAPLGKDYEVIGPEFLLEHSNFNNSINKYSLSFFSCKIL